MSMNMGVRMGISGRPTPSGSAAPFTPASLFTAGVDGVWSSRIALADLWQDSARTTPVTAVGQAVGSWRVNTALGGSTYMTNAGVDRPILRQDGNGVFYLETTGAQNLNSSPFASPLGNQESTLMVTVQKTGANTGNAGFLCYFPGSSLTAGAHRSVAIAGAGGQLMSDTAFPGNAAVSGVIPATTAVLEGRFGTQLSSAIDGGAFTTITPSNATNTPANQILSMGRGLQNVTAPGNYYGILHIVRTLTTQERTDLIAWMTALRNP